VNTQTKENRLSAVDLRMKENNLPVINWERIERSLRQQTRASGQEDACPALLGTLRSIVSCCGSFTASRKKLLAIGKALLNPDKKIVCPICLDPSDLLVPNTVPELVREHERFLESISDAFGNPPVMMLVPTHDNVSTRKETLELVQTIHRHVQSRGWQALPMEDVFSSVHEREHFWMQTLGDTEDSRRCVRAFARARAAAGLYARRNPGASETEIVDLALRTSAQYLALGELVRQNNWFICNHTTLNLSWYGKMEVALLHNPIKL